MPNGTWWGAAATAIVSVMRIRHALVAAALAAGLAGVAVPGTAHADTPNPPPVPATPGAWITGVGHFTLQEPNTENHPIRFSVLAWVDRSGTTRGVFGFRHLLPDGRVLAEGQAEVTCVNVRGGTALVTAVVPEGQGNVGNHAFYLRLTNGRPDRIETVQATNAPTRPVPYCVDIAPFGVPTYPIERGGYVFGS
jgi:hypothetical protein